MRRAGGGAVAGGGDVEVVGAVVVAAGRSVQAVCWPCGWRVMLRWWGPPPSVVCWAVDAVLGLPQTSWRKLLVEGAAGQWPRPAMSREVLGVGSVCDVVLLALELTWL